jgi:hypothetical protein
MTTNAFLKIFQIEYYHTITLGLTFSNNHNFGPSVTYEVYFFVVFEYRSGPISTANHAKVYV